MHISLPQSVVGAKDAYFVLELAFDRADVARTVEIEADQPLEVLDLEGRGPGGWYEVPGGVERLHVPVRVTADGEARPRVRVRAIDGPEAGATLAREIQLEATAPVVRGARPAGKMLVAAVVIAALGGLGLVLGPRLFGSSQRVPNLVGLEHTKALTDLAADDVLVRIVEEEVDRGDLVGRVLRTSPTAGEAMGAGKHVTLVVGVARGDLVVVPDLLGKVGDDALDVLEAADLQVLEQYEIVDDERAAGRVRRQAPTAGQHVARGTVVEVFVGRVIDANPLLADAEPETDVVPEPAVPEPAMPGPESTEPESVEPEGVGPGSVEPEGGEPERVEPGTMGEPTSELPPLPAPRHTTGHGTLPAPGEGDGDGRMGTAPAPAAGLPSPGDDDKVTIPDVTTLTIDEAERRLEALGLFAIVDFETRDNPGVKNTVLRQVPAKGVQVAPASQVYLTVARVREKPPSGDTPPAPSEPTPSEPTPSEPTPTEPTPPTPTEPTPQPPAPVADREVPDVVASTREAAEALLRRAGLGAVIQDEVTDELPAGQVISQEPAAGTKLAEGAKVVLVVARSTKAPAPTPAPTRPVEPPAGRGTVSVPDVVARTRDAAESAVRGAGLYYQIELEVTSDLPEGQVISQQPPAGAQVAPGSTVRLVVARPSLEAGVLVPDVIGRTRAEASTILGNESFRVRVRHGGGTATELGKVTDQAPAAGTRAPRYSWVEIVVASTLGGPRIAARSGDPAPLPGTTPELEGAPDETSRLRPPPGVEPGTGFRMPPPTPRGVEPAPNVNMPDPDQAAALETPGVIGHEAVAAIEDLLRAGFVVVIDPRVADGPTGRVLAQRPEPGAAAKAGDLVRLQVAVAPDPSSASVHLAHTLGGMLDKGRRLLDTAGARTEVVELQVPGHPYAGTRRIAAQFPAGSVPRSRAGIVRLWVVK
ncbi:MAG: PASTA domain-containing protein [Planctomycetota bacterium]